jgi:hypothetical protein
MLEKVSMLRDPMNTRKHVQEDNQLSTEYALITQPFWDPGDPEGTQYQVKVSGDHESNPGRPMGGSWDQIWSTEVPKRTLYGQNGPFLPLFDRFLKLGGSIWTITVLDEQSIPLRFSGHPTSLYFEKKIPTQNWPVEI